MKPSIPKSERQRISDIDELDQTVEKSEARFSVYSACAARHNLAELRHAKRYGQALLSAERNRQSSETNIVRPAEVGHHQIATSR